MQNKVVFVDLFGKVGPFVQAIAGAMPHENFAVYTCGLRDPIEIKNARFFGSWHDDRLSRLWYAFIATVLLLVKQRRDTTIVIVWSSVWLLDLMLMAWFTKVVLLEHNVIPHGKKKPLLSARLNWYLATQIVLLSDYSFSRFSVWSNLFYLEKTFILQHPLIDRCQTQEMQISKKLEGKICFFGTPRGNRGLESLCDFIEKYDDLELHIFSQVSDEFIAKYHSQKLFFHNEYLPQENFVKHMNSGGVAILPYNHSTQSGIFYSLLANQVPFLATNTGDVGIKLQSYGLDCLLIDSEKLEEIPYKLDYINNNYADIQMAINKMAIDVEANFNVALAELVS